MHAVDDRRHDSRFTLEVLAVVVLALGVRLAALHHPHFYDELYHMLAAKSLLADGTLGIAGGEPYTRARGFTYLVAGVFELAGVGMTQLRLVSVVAGTLTVALLFGWLHRATGRVTAWLAAVLLSLDPETVAYSTAGRFYALQTLFFLAAVAGAWWATLPERSARSRLAALAGVAAALAVTIHLQIASALGAGLLVLWSALALSVGPFAHAPVHDRRRWLAAVGLVVVALVVVAWSTGLTSWAARMSTFAPAWAAAGQHEFRFYYWALLVDYPLLVGLFPVLVALAVGRWPREATLCLIVVATVLAYHSLAAFKAKRFVLYVYPLFFAVSAMGVAVLLQFVLDRTRELSDRLLPGLSGVARRRISGAAVAGMVVYAMLATPGFVRLRRFVTEPVTDPWITQSAALRRLGAESDVVLGTAKLPMLHFVGRIDIVLERFDAPDADRNLDGWDAQVGRPVIGTLPAFQAVVARYPRGLVVADTSRWRMRWAVRDSLADYIERTLERVPLGDARILAFRWAHSGAPLGDADADPAAIQPR